MEGQVLGPAGSNLTNFWNHPSFGGFFTQAVPGVAEAGLNSVVTGGQEFVSGAETVGHYLNPFNW